MQKSAALDDILTRLTLHEFLLEVLMANQLTRMDVAAAERVKADLPLTVGRAYRAITAHLALTGTMEQVNLRLVEVCERFVEKVSEREAKLRAARR